MAVTPESLLWPDRFHPASLLHGIVVAVFLSGTVGCIALARIEGPSDRRRRVERAAGVVVLLLWIGNVVTQLRSGAFRLESSLPLHLCDLAALIAALSLIFERRFLATLCWFWGFGLSSQAFITPILRVGPSEPVFWWFWIGHYIIVGTGIYWAGARGYRPERIDFLRALEALLVYAALVVPFNVMYGVNYGFLGKTSPSTPTLLDSLGPWPWRIGVLALIVSAWFFLLWIAWPFARSLGRRRAARR